MKLVTDKDSKKAIAEHNRTAQHRDIPSHKKPVPSMGFDPVAPQETRDAVPDPTEEQLDAAILIEQWRRYDRRLFGELISPDGVSNGKTQRVEALVVKIQLKWVPRAWAYFEDGNYYRLGNRAYAGT